MMPTAFGLLINHDRQFSVAGNVRQSVEGGIRTVSRSEFLPKDGDVVALGCRHCCSHPRNLAWIISARRMLSAIFEWTLGDDRISSRFSRTAAISDAAMSRSAFGLFSASLLLLLLLLLGSGGVRR